MDTERQRIEEDLRGQIAGEVRCDELFVQLYASDASIYEIAPLGVVRPRTVEDLVATVRYAASNNLPLHARGSGSGLAGESLGRGLIVDFSRYMRRVLEIGEQTVRVQAGVVLDDLNRQLATHGRKFGPDPATSHVSTLGGVISLDGSGSHWPAYGSARQHVESLEVVLASGEIAQLTNHDISSAAINEHAPPLPELLGGLQAILNRYDEFITTCQPRSLVNCCGYRLDDIRQDNRLSLSRLFTGSEGTLGLITSATLRTCPLPLHVGSVLLFFESLEKAARGSLELATLQPSACDMMDRRHLSLARESDPRYDLLIPQTAEAVLLVEHQADSANDLAAKLAETVSTLHEKSKLSSGAYVADDPYDHQMLWQLARHYVPTLYRLKGNSRPVPVVEDIAVPPRNSQSSCIAHSKRSKANTSPPHSLGTPSTDSFTSVRFWILPIKTIFKKWRSWPINSTKMSGESVARLVANMAMDSAEPPTSPSSMVRSPTLLEKSKSCLTHKKSSTLARSSP